MTTVGASSLQDNPASRTFVAAALAIALLTSTTVASAVEEPKYVVTRQLDGVEVREYGPSVVAEVVVPGPASDAGSQGFKLLAGYIFGKNKGDRKISITAPVSQSPTPQTIEMTAPVTQAPTDGGYVVRFFMPAGSALETLPEPIDPRVQLKAVPGARYAVVRYSGFWSDRNYETHLAALRQTVESAGLTATGEPVYSRYDPPWTPWFMRRNEIWLELR